MSDSEQDSMQGPKTLSGSTGSLPASSDPNDVTGITGNSNGGATPRSSSRKRKPRQNPLPSDSERYETTGALGQGGWGVVEQARDKQLQREVAIKRIASAAQVPPEVRDRFLHEARITSQLQHPGIVPVHELVEGPTAGQTYYVMKLLSGQSLRALLRQTHTKAKGASQHELRETLLPLLERFIDVCNAVAYAHEQGVLHRDLKPDNVMVGEFGETIVVDWGLAKRLWESEDLRDDATIRNHLNACEALDQTGSRSDYTRAGSVIGTPAYMPPEQASGSIDEISTASDIFSLGVVLYEILVGRHPHAGLDTQTVLQRVLQGEHLTARQSRPTVPPALSAVCEKAMALAPHDRYSTASELANDVKRFISGDVVDAYPENPIEKVTRWCRKHRTLAITIAGSTFALLLVSTVAGWLVHRARLAEMDAHRSTQAAFASTLDRLEESRQAADTWLIELSGALEFYPGLQPVRQHLIQQATEHYSKLLETSPQLSSSSTTATHRLDRQFKLEKGKVQLRIADLLRLNDDPDAAKRHYARAAEELEPLLQDADLEQRVVTAARLQRTNVVVGQLLLGPLATVDWQRWEEWLDEQLLQHGLSAATPNPSLSADTFDLISCRARFSLALAMNASACDDSESSWIRSNEAVAWAQCLADSRGTPADHQKLQTALTFHAELAERCRVTAATEAWRALYEFHDNNYSAAPNRIDHLQSLAYAGLRWANALAGNPALRDDAVERFEQAIANFRKSWQLADGDGFYQRNLAAAENNLGRLLASAGPDNLAKAETHLESSIAIRRSLLRQQPSVEELRLFCNSVTLLTTLRSDDQSEQQLALLNDVDTCYQLIQDHGQLSDSDRDQWVATLLRRATLFEAQGDAAAAMIDRATADRIRP